MIYNRPRRAEEKASLKWYFNRAPVGAKREFSANFRAATSNQLYDGISVSTVGMKYTYGDTYDTVYVMGKWLNVTYRTITFTEPPTGDLLTWLQARATPQ